MKPFYRQFNDIHKMCNEIHTHNGGYLMCLSVDANGVLNMAVSVAARPFKGDVTFSVLNQ